ncbi:hypothetical protein KY304_02240 [Candidatus Woesearchaeota archaeon]|nr:hypothetical protein [Candidatus Woesearchaeota archaeon]MBW2978906.1 hypothetical protein [Candidatus Woesearchaeota archaeon]
MNKNMILFILVIILGVYFFGKGITGLVVSQTCCSGPDCDAENLCDYAQETFSTPWMSYLFIVFGLGLVVVAISSYVKNKNSSGI